MAVASVGAWLGGIRFGLGVDDSDIFLVYGRNLAEGNGFVWTVGGERVEGFTSLLWTLINAVPFLTDLPPRETLLGLSVALCGLSIFLMCYLLKLAGVGKLLLAGAAIPLFLPYFLVWNTVTLMETALWAAVISVLVVAIIRDLRWWALALSVISPLVRPEAMLVVPGMLLLSTWSHPEGWRRGLTRSAPALFGVFLSVGALTLWRLWYFGYPLPNTYYAKVSTDISYELFNGFVYVVGWLGEEVWPIPALLAAGFWVGRRADRIPAVLSACALWFLMVTVASGGDHFAGGRFLQPAIPILVVIGLISVSRLWRRKPRKISRRVLMAAYLPLTVLFVLRWGRMPDEVTMADHFFAAEIGRVIGQVLSDRFPSLPTIGSVAVGGIGFNYQGTVLDLEGLNWTKMAHSGSDRRGRYPDHEAFDDGVFWESPPTVVVPAFLNPDLESEGRYLCEEDGWWDTYLLYLPGLLTSDRFFRHYDLGILAEDSRGIEIMAFVERTWAAEQGIRRLNWDHCRPGTASISE
jgi:hypothetical protein